MPVYLSSLSIFVAPAQFAHSTCLCEQECRNNKHNNIATKHAQLRNRKVFKEAKSMPSMKKSPLTEVARSLDSPGPAMKKNAMWKEQVTI